MLTVWVQAWSAYYIRWVWSGVRSLQVRCSLALYQWLRRDRGELIIQEPVIHRSLPLSLSDSVYICLFLIPPLSISFSPHCPALLRPETTSHVDPGAASQAASQGNYLELAGHLMRFMMIYVALCTENRIRDPHIGLLLINSTLSFHPGYISILYWQRCDVPCLLLYKEGN